MARFKVASMIAFFEPSRRHAGNFGAAVTSSVPARTARTTRKAVNEAQTRGLHSILEPPAVEQDFECDVRPVEFLQYRPALECLLHQLKRCLAGQKARQPELA